MFNSETDMKDPKFYVGLVFTSGVFNSVHGFVLLQPIVVQQHLYGEKYNNICTVKTFNGEHRCARTNTNKFVTSRWLSKKYTNDLHGVEKFDMHKF